METYRGNIKGFIFDMDGVVTQTATLHFEAWKKVIEQFLEQMPDDKNQAFTEDDYFNYLDGMPRKEGLEHFFKARRLKDNLSPLNQEECIEKISDEKNKLFGELITSREATYFQDTIQFIEFLILHQFKIALISSSKNCIPILKSAQIEHLFPIYVDGIISEDLKIRGKPEPDIFLEAAKRLELTPQECFVVEDALAGVKAGKAGGFGGVIALDRKNKLHSQFLLLQPDYLFSDLYKADSIVYPYIKKKPIQPAIQALTPISSLCKLNKQWIVFSDYDGTLTPIVDRPEYAILSPKMRECLTHFAKFYPLVIISGRELNDLKNLINIPTIYYSGNHGFEFTGPDYSFQMGEEFKEEINEVYKHLLASLSHITGCLIENKKFSLSVHYRLVKEISPKLIEAQIDEIITNYPNLKKHLGKKVFEIRPNIIWDKGIASNYILNEFKLKNPNLIPIYIGDDRTDEDAFEAFQYTGITVKVTENLEETKAHYYISSPEEVQSFLTKLTSLKEHLL